MSFVTIARRELEERRIILIAAAAFALLPVLLAIVPLAGTPSERILVTGRVVSIGFTLIVAFVLGASVIGRDLSSGQLSFYFERPVNASAIWLGKLAAAALLVVAAFAISYLPVLVVQGPSDGDRLRTAVRVVIAALGLLLIAHTLSTMVRSKSWLIGLDLVAASCAFIGGYFVIERLVRGGADNLAFNVLAVIVVGALLSIVVAGLWQLHRGRADRRRSHHAFSAALWAGVAVTLLAAGVFVLFIVSRGPEAMRFDEEDSLFRRGDVLMARGVVRSRWAGGYSTTFIVNESSGNWQRMPRTLSPWGVRFAPDGSSVAWLEYAEPWKEAYRRLTFFLKHDGPIPVDLYSAKTSDVHASRLIATLQDRPLQFWVSSATIVMLSGTDSLAVYDARSGALRAAAKLPASVSERGVLRLIQLDSGFFLAGRLCDKSVDESVRPCVVDIRRIDPDTASLGPVASARFVGCSGITVESARDRQSIDVLTSRKVADGRSFEDEWISLDPLTATVRARETLRSPGQVRLSDGRIAETYPKTERMLLIDGKPIPGAPFARRPLIVAEVAPSKVIVTWLKWDKRSTEGLETIDLNSGQSSARAADLTWRSQSLEKNGTVLVTDREGRLVRWNPLTGARTPFAWQ